MKPSTAVTHDYAIALGHTPVQKPPKSHAGRRDIVLDDDTHAALAAYRRRRNTRRLAAGPAWADTGLFFTRPDGQPWHPPPSAPASPG